MKKMLTVFLALMLVWLFSITAFADAPVQTPSDNPMTTSQAAPSTADPVPQVGEGASESTEGSSDPGTLEQPDAVQEESPPAPEKPKSSNTPYFVGAIIAVIVFISVAMYCKFNGNGNVIR